MKFFLFFYITNVIRNLLSIDRGTLCCASVYDTTSNWLRRF